MSLRQRQWASRAKAALIAEMGSCCWACGATSLLEIDHWRPKHKPYRSHSLASDHRISRYRAEWKAGELQLLCEACNNKHSQSFEPHLYSPPPGVAPPPAMKAELESLGLLKAENEPF